MSTVDERQMPKQKKVKKSPSINKRNSNIKKYFSSEDIAVRKENNFESREALQESFLYGTNSTMTMKRKNKRKESSSKLLSTSQETQENRTKPPM